MADDAKPHRGVGRVSTATYPHPPGCTPLPGSHTLAIPAPKQSHPSPKQPCQAPRRLREQYPHFYPLRHILTNRR
ncbi:hypothetical protein E2C01_024717 [Portunus trituberculatus]|uniref:Uncharacterized protein n=1 Tax=Portunus trituberculatus TaxID=210409 RepID=A0A5B7EDM9_PORTR|nr:hypothetical protein [Portunus trituberculatus]